MITVAVKGPRKSAKRAAARHGVSITKCMPVSGRQVVCQAPCSARLRLIAWLSAHGHMKKGRGSTPGTLLHYNANCGYGDDLRGPRRRRRRR